MSKVLSNGSPSILVTAVSGGSIGEQLCKALTLPGDPIHVFIANTTLAPMSIMPVDWPRVILPLARDPKYVASVLTAAHELSVKFIVPGSEVELAMLSSHQQELTEHGLILLANNTEVIETCLDKTRCMTTLQRHGFRVPQSHTPTNAKDFNVPGGNYPVILKPEKAGGGSAMCFLAQDDEELTFFQKYIFEAGIQPLVQEYIGTVFEEYTIGVLHRPDRSLFGVVVMRRDVLSGLSNRVRLANRTGRADLGSVLGISSGITQGTFVRHDAVATAALKMAEVLESTGPLNIQGRWDGSAFVPFEINPRFSGTTPMRAMAGFNEPWEIIRWHVGQTTGSPLVIQGGSFHRGLVEHFAPNEASIPVFYP